MAHRENFSQTYNEQKKRLFEGILLLRTVEECEQFFRDLLTGAELQEISKRFRVAQLLYQGSIQREVVKVIKEEWGKASSSTRSKNLVTFGIIFAFKLKG